MKFPFLPPALALFLCLGLAGVMTGCGASAQKRASQQAPRVEAAPPPPVSFMAMEDSVHITRNGKAYHEAGCRYLASSDFLIARSEAVKQGLKPCTNCENAHITVHITKTGHAFHRAGCKALDKSDMVESRADALRQGLKSCSKCGG